MCQRHLRLRLERSTRRPTPHHEAGRPRPGTSRTRPRPKPAAGGAWTLRLLFQLVDPGMWQTHPLREQEAASGNRPAGNRAVTQLPSALVHSPQEWTGRGVAFALERGAKRPVDPAVTVRDPSRPLPLCASPWSTAGRILLDPIQTGNHEPPVYWTHTVVCCATEARTRPLHFRLRGVTGEYGPFVVTRRAQQPFGSEHSSSVAEGQSPAARTGAKERASGSTLAEIRERKTLGVQDGLGGRQG